jgi:hypothetical protein
MNEFLSGLRLGDVLRQAAWFEARPGQPRTCTVQTASRVKRAAIDIGEGHMRQEKIVDAPTGRRSPPLLARRANRSG